MYNLFACFLGIPIKHPLFFGLQGTSPRPVVLLARLDASPWSSLDKPRSSSGFSTGFFFSTAGDDFEKAIGAPWPQLYSHLFIRPFIGYEQDAIAHQVGNLNLNTFIGGDSCRTWNIFRRPGNPELINLHLWLAYCSWDLEDHPRTWFNG